MAKDIIFRRRSNFYSANLSIWQRIYAAYGGGARYIEKALIPHVSENKLEFKERKKRAIYLNYPRKIASMITEFLFASDPDRNEGDENIIKDFSRDGRTANDFFMQCHIIRTLFGVCWILVDYPVVADKIDAEQKQKAKIRPYAKVLMPFNVVDWAYGNDGELLWVLIAEELEKKDSPYDEPKKIRQRRLWTRTAWELYQQSDSGQQLISSGIHNLGRVPVIKWDEVAGYGIGCNHWFEDVVKISDAILNSMSEAQMNVIKQMFGLLVVSEAFATAGGETRIPEDDTPEARAKAEYEQNEYRLKLARSSALWETQEEKGLTRYISPDGVETRVIIEFMKFLKESLNDVLRLAIQSSSKAAQTAESKEWDSLNTTQFLANRAISLEQTETKVWDLMYAWDADVKVPKVSYSREFSINGIQTMVNCLMDISSFDAGEEFQRACYEKALVILDKIDRLPQEQYQKIKDEILTMQVNKTPIPAMKIDGLMQNIGKPQPKTGDDE